jgi:hypothetical protein
MIRLSCRSVCGLDRQPLPMLPKMFPSTCRAFGSIAETLLRRAGMPLEPPVKNTVSTCATSTEASPAAG